MKVRAQACLHPGADLEPFEYETEALGPDDVDINISHCGICHSDIHLIDDDWGTDAFPLVPGHEIIGMVAAIGSNVKKLEKGMRVGVGWQRGSCGDCYLCKQGDENLCTRMKATCIGGFGGFAQSVRCDQHFVFPIPEVIPSEQAAPLLCAGVTVYAPLARAQVGNGSKVAVLGIGGLGHLALQYAKAMGAEVTAISSTEGKKKEAESLGADHFIHSDNRAQMRRASRSFDFMLSTSSAAVDWTRYLAQVSPNGSMCFVGVPKDPLGIPAGVLVGGQKSIAGSFIGGTRAMQEMFEFSAKHEIVPRVDVMPMNEANDGVKLVRDNQARYRVVLINI